MVLYYHSLSVGVNIFKNSHHYDTILYIEFIKTTHKIGTIILLNNLWEVPNVQNFNS